MTRLFLAVLPDEEMKQALTEVQRQLAERKISGRMTDPDALHLTLAFIGEYDPERVMEVLDGFHFEPFLLRLDGIGMFHDLIWCGGGDDADMENCVSRLRRRLAANGIPYDRKAFKAHFTLVRNAAAGLEKAAGILVPDVMMTAERISLMRSDRTKHGMVYTEIGCVYAEEEEDIAYHEQQDDMSE